MYQQVENLRNLNDNLELKITIEQSLDLGTRVPKQEEELDESASSSSDEGVEMEVSMV